jgi:NADH dehydrogenase FAD-containing subunit
MAISRRKALQLSGIAVAATAVAGCSNSNDPQPNTKSTKETTSADYKAPIADTKNPRVVVVGGGWSGLSIAKYTKIFAPNTDVILVEQRHEFISCPMSNLWLVDKIELEYLTHDYLQAARENNYTYFHATAVGLDKENRILKTSDGDISFDYLVFAPGIDYDYSRWTDDIAFETRLRQEYPAGFIPGSEHITLKNKVQNFKGGNFILTVPSGNYRCLPAPYERACVIADYFKQKGLKAKVILLDENNAITIKKDGFQSAFDELYSDYIEYMPNTTIKNIDLDKKIVETGFDEIEFEEAAFYPHVRGAKILERAGVAKDAKNMLEGDINPLTYEVNGLKNVFVTGDSRPMGFSKSGNTSNSEGHFVAKLIAQKINKTPVLKWESPTTTCFSVVATNPEKAIYIYSEYAYNKTNASFSFTDTSASEDWKKDGIVNGKSVYNWADALYADMFKK